MALAQRTTVAGAESGGGDGGRHEGSVTVEGRGGLFRRDDQRLLVLLTKYVLVKSEVGKEACSELQTEGGGAEQRALRQLDAAAVKVQSTVARGCRGRAKAREASEGRRRAREMTKMEWAILLMQKRHEKSSTRMAKLALKRYYRCIDTPSGAEYYFNPKTGKSSWTKPAVLGKFDIPTAIVMPAGDEPLLVLMCRECGLELATEMCGDCDDMFCDPCAARLHRTAKTKKHLRVLIDSCDECQFQVATKYCIQCKDNFCHTCFCYVHRRGRLRRHTFDPLAAMCHDCGESPQAQRCWGCHHEGLLLLCHKCQRARHEGLSDEDLHFHT
ncbi:unnamed protein product [Sphacelaria rigidula]